MATKKAAKAPVRRVARESKARPYLERWLVEQLMFGSGRVRRFTQDSPVLPDVWFEYALDPQMLHRRLTRATGEPADLHPPVNLLLTPFRETPAGVIRKEVSRRVTVERKRAEWKKHGHNPKSAPRIIYNQSTTAATLYFEDLVRAVIPMSDWWRKLTQRFDPALLQREDIQIELANVVRDPEHPARSSSIPKLPPDVLWLIRVVGAIAIVHRGDVLPPVFYDEKRGPAKAEPDEWLPLVRAVAALMNGVEKQDESARIYSVALNRIASPTVFGSRRAVKADAAERVFHVSCKEIRWAIIDSGIDATHTAFRERDKDGKPLQPDASKPFNGYKSRIRRTYDFSQIHHLLDPDATEQQKQIRRLTRGKKREASELTKRIATLNDALSLGSSIDWGLIAPLLEIPHDASYVLPSIDHGTHVAGILGAGEWPQGEGEDPLLGICPDIQFYDLRILDENGEGDEFTVMAALQFVRWLNSTNDYVAVHGVNLSLSIPHDVANYACGRTPVCDEAERVVSTGVVVVAAAGNLGYRKYTTPDGPSEAYNTISITDPGNAENVITVGATHRGRPHTYGVSYFSSRGPTGDGRHKPDLVAPGEKITSVLPDESSGVKDGTSMAAPHVSGAAAMLMARHDELIGDPERIKKILCSTATDLGRERYFQGAGMLDILRALQAV